MNGMVAQALKEAVSRHVGKDATPTVCGAIKREFIHIMRDKFGVNWVRHSRKISVEFVKGSVPNVIIPEELLERTVH